GAAAACLRRAAFARAGAAAGPAEPGAGQQLFFANPADLGTGEIHPLSRFHPVAGLGLALCRAHLCSGARLTTRPRTLKWRYEPHRARCCRNPRLLLRTPYLLLPERAQER